MNETATADGAAVETDASTEPAILARDIRKSYGDVVALDGVDLAVESGEVFGLIGPNGAGKTTLVRALTGTTTVEGDGEVRVLGAAPNHVDPARIGLLPQSFDPPARLTARELVDYYGGLYDDPLDTETVLADVGLAEDADAWYETLSGGQRRRACVATALVNDPDVLFLDEPTTGIDPAGRRSLHALIESLAAGGTTVFLTSHAMDEVERLADRAALLRDGRVVAEGAPDALVDEYGGEPRLEVSLKDGTAPDAVVESVAAETTHSISATADGLRFSGIEPEGIAAAVDALAAAGVGFESLSWTEPTLEDVYLALTGESYTPREGSADTEESGNSVSTVTPTSDTAEADR